MNEDEEIEEAGVSLAQNSLVPANSATRSQKTAKDEEKVMKDEAKKSERMRIAVQQEVSQPVEDSSRNHSNIVRQINDSGRNDGLNQSQPVGVSSRPKSPILQTPSQSDREPPSSRRQQTLSSHRRNASDPIQAQQQWMNEQQQVQYLLLQQIQHENLRRQRTVENSGQPACGGNTPTEAERRRARRRARQAQRNDQTWLIPSLPVPEEEKSVPIARPPARSQPPRVAPPPQQPVPEVVREEQKEERKESQLISNGIPRGPEEGKLEQLIAEQSMSNRVKNFEETESIQDVFTCVICTENCLLKTPKFCTSCQNAIFCQACIHQWLKNKRQCPLCKSSTGTFKHVQEAKDLTKLLSIVQLKCKNEQTRDCKYYGPFYELAAHEEWCDRVYCTFCDEQMTYDDLKTHRCFQMYLRKTGKNKQDFYIKREMITSQSAMLSALKCAECDNIVRQPEKCGECENIYCKFCLHESGFWQQGICPNRKCHKTFEEGSQINRQLLNALQNLTISCKKCGKDVGYEKYDEHTLRCQRCLFCGEDTSGTGTDKHIEECKYTIYNRSCPTCNERVPFDKNKEFKKVIDKDGREVIFDGRSPPGHTCGVMSGLCDDGCLNDNGRSPLYCLASLQMIGSLIEVFCVILIYMLLHIPDLELRDPWLVRAYSLTSLASLFAGFTLLFFRYAAVACVFIQLQVAFAGLFVALGILLISEDDTVVKFYSYDAEEACNILVTELGILMLARLVIFTAQLLIITYRLRRNYDDEQERRPSRTDERKESQIRRRGSQSRDNYAIN